MIVGKHEYAYVKALYMQCTLSHIAPHQMESEYCLVCNALYLLPKTSISRMLWLYYIRMYCTDKFVYSKKPLLYRSRLLLSYWSYSLTTLTGKIFRYSSEECVDPRSDSLIVDQRNSISGNCSSVNCTESTAQKPSSFPTARFLFVTV